MLPVVTSCDQVWPDVNINSKALVFAKGVLNFAQIQKKQPLPNSPPQVHLGPDLVVQGAVKEMSEAAKNVCAHTQCGIAIELQSKLT